MKVHGLLLQRHGGRSDERCHDDQVSVDQRNTRWCSDELEILCGNGEKGCVAFALDCCDRDAIGGTAQGSGDAKHRWKGCEHVAATSGIIAGDVQDLMLAIVKHLYSRVDRLPKPIEWLTDYPVLSLSNGAAATLPTTPTPLPTTSG